MSLIFLAKNIGGNINEKKKACFRDNRKIKKRIIANGY